MSDQGDPLARIANALERLAPGHNDPPDWHAAPAYAWSAEGVRAIERIDALPLERLIGIERQKAAVCENIARHAAGHAAHDMLLWGARGTGKSALLRAAVAHEQRGSARLALVQLDLASLDALPRLFETLRKIDRRFLLFIDDLAFDTRDHAALRSLRSALEGSLDPRPANVRLAVTTNHRAILAREAQDQAEPLSARDRMDDSLALADRFGIRLGFHPFDSEGYLAIVRAHAEPLGLAVDAEEALTWSRRQGQLSGRSARQFVTELAGRAGKPA